MMMMSNSYPSIALPIDDDAADGGRRRCAHDGQKCANGIADPTPTDDDAPTAGGDAKIGDDAPKECDDAPTTAGDPWPNPLMYS